MQVLSCSRWGEPNDVLSLNEQPMPVAGAGEVLVKMLASPVNPSDLMTIRGVYGHRPELPFVPGYEGVGVVEQANAGLYGRWLMGRRVAVPNATGRHGNWREWTTLPAKSAIPVPKGLPDEQAAMFFVNPATAFLLTRVVLALPKGAWLVQSAAASAVGKLVIRLGRKHGFRTINLVRRAQHTEMLQDLGADAVIPFDPATDSPDDLRSRLQAHNLPVDDLHAGIDPVGGPTASAMLNVLAPGGRLISYGSLDPSPMSLSPRMVMTNRLTYEGFWLGPYMSQLSLWSKLRLIGELNSLFRTGVAGADPVDVVPFRDWRRALSLAEQPGRTGKIVLRMGE